MGACFSGGRGELEEVTVCAVAPGYNSEGLSCGAACGKISEAVNPVVYLTDTSSRFCMWRRTYRPINRMQSQGHNCPYGASREAR